MSRFETLPDGVIEKLRKREFVTGEIIGDRYRLKSPLGAGAMGYRGDAADARRADPRDARVHAGRAGRGRRRGARREKRITALVPQELLDKVAQLLADHRADHQ